MKGIINSILGKYEKVAPGLAIVQEEDLYWLIKQIKNDRNVLVTDTKEKAISAAKELADIANWNVEENDVPNKAGVSKEYLKIVAKYHSARKFNGLYLNTKDNEGNVTFFLKTEKGDKKIKGKHIDNGIAVCEEKKESYLVVHVPRGIKMTTLKTEEHAIKVAEAIKSILPWDELKVPEMIEGSADIRNYLKQVREAVEKGEEIPPVSSELELEILMFQIPQIEKNMGIFKEAMKELNSLIGLDELKRAIIEKLEDLKGRMVLEKEMKVQLERPNLHMLFLGSPGTGKTEVARIMGKVYYAFGYLSKPDVLEVKNTDLVAEYVGQTGPKTRDVIKKAMGGILFIDEAHQFAVENAGGYAKEAVGELLTALENNRDQFVCICAGYQDKMRKFLDMDPGLEGRFATQFKFKDYTPSELAMIVRKRVESKGFNCERASLDIEKIIESNSTNGSMKDNARWARTFSEKLIVAHSRRIGKSKDGVGVISRDDVLAAMDIQKQSEQYGIEAVKKRALEKLDGLIGLNDLKEEVKRLMSEVEVNKKRFEEGMDTARPNLHSLFLGPPGTGKTTVAHILGQFFKGIGLVTNGQVISKKASDMIAQHVGNTAQKVKDVFSEADGGILIIDEAYAIADSSFGKEAMTQIITEMEERRHNTVVIFAGYEKDMKKLDELNPGFRSRVPNVFWFPHYSLDEIFQLAKLEIESQKLVLTPDAEEELKKEINLWAEETKGVIKGNGRWVRNIIEKLRTSQAVRVDNEKTPTSLEVKAEDIKDAFTRHRSVEGLSKETKAEEREKAKEESLEKLNTMVGLEEIKTQVKRIMNQIVVQKKKIERGIQSDQKPMMHMVFAGPPGTGKTTVAAVIGQFLKGAGILSKGHYVAVDTGDLVAQYTGQTDKIVKEKVEEAKGGVLFIDEAYGLAETAKFGREAINTLIKEMEDKREDLIVILAGYEDKMKNLLQVNPGFESRIKYTFNFPSYSVAEICEIVNLIVESQNHKLSEEARKVLIPTISEFSLKKPNALANGNGRWARTFYEQLKAAQENRIANIKDEEFEEYDVFKEEDVLEAIEFM